MKFNTSDGESIYYEVSGHGIPCVFMHGGPGYWSKSFQHYVENSLENELKMIYVDQRGCGRSGACTNQDYSLNRLINDFEELRRHLGIEQWIVLAHSFGGIIAVNYAKQYPLHTKSLILSNVTLHMKKSFEHQINQSYKLLGRKNVEFNSKNLEDLLNAYFDVVNDMIENKLFDQLQFINIENKIHMNIIDEEFSTDPNFQQEVFSSEEYFQDFTPLTKTIEQPTFIIGGEFDHSVGPSHHDNFQFNQSITKVLKTSHHPYIENIDEFSKEVIYFIRHEDKNLL
ncbi:alpha/beta fold hydrolase [Piscibacillus sp. B03]|uniref:alpha/beta fold hydrolase n=1 Tax=Piscibacillus sp. B03 TaxID=3457430 RepID=UPI003FCE9E08